MEINFPLYLHVQIYEFLNFMEIPRNFMDKNLSY